MCTPNLLDMCGCAGTRYGGTELHNWSHHDICRVMESRANLGDASVLAGSVAAGGMDEAT